MSNFRQLFAKLTKFSPNFRQFSPNFTKQPLVRIKQQDVIMKYIFILILLSYCECEIFHFNATLECKEKDNCKFYNPEIWQDRDNEDNNNSVPTDGDTVYLVGNNEYTIYIPETSHVMLELFYVSGNFTFKVIDSTNSKAQSNNLELVAILVDIRSSLQVVSVGLNNTGATQLNANSALSFYSAIASLILSAPGSGSIKITDSTVNLTNPYMSEISEIVMVGGISTVFVDGIKFYNSNLVILPGNITFIAQWIELNGNFSVEGQLSVQEYAHVVTNGNVSFSRDITIIGATFLASGVLSGGGAIVLDAGVVANSSFIARSPLTITTPSLLIRANCVFANEGPVAIYGDVINGGTFYVNKFADSGLNQNITIIGDYIQNFGAMHIAYLSTDVSACVNANNVTIAGGEIAYIAPEKVPVHSEFTILQATNQEISGEFSGDLRSYDESNSNLQKMRIIYDSHVVVIIPIPPSTLLGFGWGVILGILFVALMVILVVAIVAVNLRRSKKRKDYKILFPLQSVN